MLYVTNILVELRVDGHVFGADSEPFAVLILVLYVENKGNACRVLGHHFFYKAHRQVHSLDNQRLVSLVV